MVYIAGHEDTRLRDLASELNVTERTAFGVVDDLVDAGYVLKERDGRRNRYTIQVHLPLPDAIDGEHTVGELLDLLGRAEVRPKRRRR